MRKTLWYVFPNSEPVRTQIQLEDQHKLTWLYAQVESFPEAIFFYTVDSTDIWDTERLALDDFKDEVMENFFGPKSELVKFFGEKGRPDVDSSR
jgi:hypothetical protein